MDDIRLIDFGSNEAKYDDLEKYFFDNGDIERVEKGDIHLIVGRKGSGKTAVATYLNKLAVNRYDRFSNILLGGEIPLGLIDKFEDSRFSGPSKYVPVWRYILLIELSKLILSDESIRDYPRMLLNAFVELNCPDLKAKAVDYMSSTIEQGLKLKVKVVEAHITKKSDQRTEEIDLLRYLDRLQETIIQQSNQENTYLLFCDELDDIYESRPDDYNDILIGLMKAIDQINSAAAGRGVCIRAIALMREDIYKKLKYSDRNKIKDRRMDINWSFSGGSPLKSSLFKMLNLRIGVSLVNNVDPHADYWSRIMTKDEIRGKVSPFSFMISRTFLRPRDVIEYAKCLQRVCQTRKIKVADRQAFVDAEQEYSEWFKDELVDEVSSSVPDIDSVLDAIRDHGKSTFFAADINRYFQRANIESETSVNNILSKLFDFSVIGIFDNPSRRTPDFKYRDPTKRFRSKKMCSVHYGLRNSLDLH